MRAETLHALITGLDIGPCIIAGGSGGARDSMLTTMLYPEIVTQAGGVEHRRRRLRIVRARGPLHRARASWPCAVWASKAFCTWRSGRSASRRTRPTRTASWPGRRRVPQGDAALAQRVRVQAGPDHSRRRRRDVRQHQGAHADHPRRRERLGPPQAHLAGSELPDQGFHADRPAVARGRLGARRRRRARREGQGSACSTPGCRPRPRFWTSWAADAAASHRADAHLTVSDASSAVWIRLSGTARQVGFAQRHRDDVPAVAAGRRSISPVSPKPASTPWASSSVPRLTKVSTPAIGSSAECLGAQRQSPSRFSSSGRRRPSAPQLRGGRAASPRDRRRPPRRRLLGQQARGAPPCPRVSCAGVAHRRVDIDAHHCGSHAPQPSRTVRRARLGRGDR